MLDCITIELGIDPFFYFETLSRLTGIPPLIYRWKIERILMQTAPFIESDLPVMGKVMVRDPSKLAYREIERTDAWHDDGGNGDYLLECRRVVVRPTHRRGVEP